MPNEFKVLSLPEESQKDTVKCFKEIQAILQKYHCRIEAEIVITRKGNTPRIRIVQDNPEN